MKISCQSCQAKYTIADEKVLGKIVRIRCKKCSATIVINGNEPAPAASPSTAALTEDPPVSGIDQQPGAPDEWVVNVAEGDQRTFLQNELVDAYLRGIVDETTFCWRDGMPEWLPLKEVDALYAACQTARRALTDVPQTDLGASPTSTPSQQAAEAAVEAPGGPSPFAADLTPIDNPAPLPTPAPAAARRAAGRVEVDLFGGPRSEPNALAAAPVSEPVQDDGSVDFSGKRGDDSVLFTLSNLDKKGEGENRTTAQGEGSGLIDIRAIAASSGADKKPEKSSDVDDILNLGGGGVFGSVSTAGPRVQPPPGLLGRPEPSSVGYPSQPVQAVHATAAAPSKAGPPMALVAVLGLIIVLMLGAGGAMLYVSRNSDTVKTAPSAATSATAQASVTPPAAVSGPATATAVAIPTPTSSSAADPQDAGPLAKKDAGKLPDAATVDAAVAETPDTGAPPAAAESAFNVGAAKGPLGAIASGVQSCKKGDTPTGRGVAVVVFKPDGRVASSNVLPPYLGTPTGLCVAQRFYAATVPPFTGGNSPPISKTFYIQ